MKIYQRQSLKGLNPSFDISFKKSFKGTQVQQRQCKQQIRERKNLLVNAQFGWFNKKKNDKDEREQQKAVTTVYENRSDYTNEDVEQYFNYMGMLATEGSYDSMNQMLNSGLDHIDIILIWASRENDLPKIEELLGAGANPTVKGPNGKTPIEETSREDIVELLQQKAKT